jgi:hypothetical protein
MGWTFVSDYALYGGLMDGTSFDDINALNALNALASDDFGEWDRELEITQELIDGFAALTGNDRWIPVDVDRARRESPFGGTIAQRRQAGAPVPDAGPVPLTAARTAPAPITDDDAHSPETSPR